MLFALTPKAPFALGVPLRTLASVALSTFRMSTIRWCVPSRTPTCHPIDPSLIYRVGRVCGAGEDCGTNKPGPNPLKLTLTLILTLITYPIGPAVPHFLSPAVLSRPAFYPNPIYQLYSHFPLRD